MEERRFDAWTRTLGAATSRRQVLKGMLGGVLAVVAGRAVEPAIAEAAGGCSPQSCERKVDQFFTTCIQGCAVIGAARGTRDPRVKAYCRSNCYLASRALSEQCTHNGGCFGSEGTCCTDHCVDLDTDPNNCGACGHACDPGVACTDGQCQCDADQTLCGTTCVDTERDNDNCGACGHVCGDCEQCVAGTCQPLDCDSDGVCCQHACYPKCEHNQMDPQTCQCGFCDHLEDGTTCGPASVCCQHDCVDTTCPDGRQFNDNTCQCDCTPIDCPDGQAQDPTTCQCVSICITEPAGTNCGTNMVCCGQQCVSTTCPAGRTFSSDTCQCECTPVECPTGQTQNPLTCQCEDKCASVTCDTCQTCDPSSGQCVNVADHTDCDGGNVCCNGACQADCICTVQQCSNGDCCPNSDDWQCCEDGCCPRTYEVVDDNYYAYCLAPGSRTDPGLGIPSGKCCQPEDLRLFSIINDETSTCSCADVRVFYCAGNMPATYEGSTTCDCGPATT